MNIDKKSVAKFFKKNINVVYGLATFLFVFAVIFGTVALVKNKTVANIETNQQNQEEIVEPVNTKTNTTFITPVSNAQIIKDFSATNLKYNSTLKQWEAHKAIDLISVENAEVYSVLDGEVVNVENSYLMGNIVTISHTDGLQTVYASLSDDVKVAIGDKVKQGDLIGYTSTSAKAEASDGDHLHFEVIKDDVKVDPNLYITVEDK